MCDFFRAKSVGFALPKHDLVIPSQNMYPASDFQDFPGFSTKSRPIFLNFYPTDFFENWNSFWDRSETFISAILWRNTKIRVPPGTHLSVGFCNNSKMTICTTPASGLQWPHFEHFFDFFKKYFFGNLNNLTKIFDRMLINPRIRAFHNEFWSHWNVYEKILKNKKVRNIFPKLVFFF